MPIVNRLADFHDEIAEWRRDIHAHPELPFDEHRTAALVAGKLKDFGVDELATGIAKTGVVGIIHGRTRTNGRVIGLRADMDALPIRETSGVDHMSSNDGVMHACGHDGHTAMLLGAAKYLAETRNFDGTVALIFQPAEEGGGGGKIMVEEGVMDRWDIDEVYGLHNYPGLKIGEFAICKGPILAAADKIKIEIEGFGGHGARPHACIDPILVGAHVVQAVQSIVARNVDPLESAVVSITVFKAGEAHNVIPHTAQLKGTIRTFKRETRDIVKQKLEDIIHSTAAAYGATARIKYDDGYPVTFNHDDQTDFAVKVARDVSGHDLVHPDHPPVTGSEDFSYMLEARPGAFIFMGNGDTANLHHPDYDFNDEAIPVGSSYWVRLVETAMPA